jgi:Flp pilus assembly pilin Flp
MRWIEWGWLMMALAQERWAAGAHRRWMAQSTVEYALVGALVVIAAAGALTILGGELTTVFSNISKTLGAAAGK